MKINQHETSQYGKVKTILEKTYGKGYRYSYYYGKGPKHQVSYQFQKVNPGTVLNTRKRNSSGHHNPSTNSY